MAYINQEDKKALAPKIKEICKKYGVKATLAIIHHSTLALNIKESALDFGLGDKTYESVNVYHYMKYYDGDALKFLTEVIEAMNIGNYDYSDPMTDYFNVGWYVDVNIGKWNKPYILKGE